MKLLQVSHQRNRQARRHGSQGGDAGRLRDRGQHLGLDGGEQGTFKKKVAAQAADERVRSNSPVSDRSQLELYRGLWNLGAQFREDRDADKVSRSALRFSLDFFDAREGCVAVNRPEREHAEIVHPVPQESWWDTELLAAFLWGRTVSIPPEPLLLPSTGPLISSALFDLPFQQSTLTLDDGDSLLFYTDGITEAHGPEGLFGRERMLSAIQTNGCTGSELLGRLLSAVSQFSESRPIQDDMTLLSVEYAAA